MSTKQSKDIIGTPREDLETPLKNPKVGKNEADKIINKTGENVKAELEAKKQLTPEQQEKLMVTVKTRFEANKNRHEGIRWTNVQAKLEASLEKMWSLNEMERTGGEPDVVRYDNKTDEYIFNDCSAESPSGRRNICYDREGQEEAEKDGFKPDGNAIDMAKKMGIRILSEKEYRELQKLGDFDVNSETWIDTPADIRKFGVALGGYRYNGEVRVDQTAADDHRDDGAFRGSLRV
jgi:hypothetical protein